MNRLILSVVMFHSAQAAWSAIPLMDLYVEPQSASSVTAFFKTTTKVPADRLRVTACVLDSDSYSFRSNWTCGQAEAIDYRNDDRSWKLPNVVVRAPRGWVMIMISRNLNGQSQTSFIAAPYATSKTVNFTEQQKRIRRIGDAYARETSRLYGRRPNGGLPGNTVPITEIPVIVASLASDALRPTRVIVKVQKTIGVDDIANPNHSSRARFMEGTRTATREPGSQWSTERPWTVHQKVHSHLIVHFNVDMSQDSGTFAAQAWEEVQMSILGRTVIVPQWSGFLRPF